MKVYPRGTSETLMGSLQFLSSWNAIVDGTKTRTLRLGAEIPIETDVY